MRRRRGQQDGAAAESAAPERPEDAETPESEPETPESEAEAPEAEAETPEAEADAPEAEAPAAGAPEAEAPAAGAPEAEAPEAGAPEAEAPAVGTPDPDSEAAEAAEDEAEPEPEPDPVAAAQAERDSYLELARRTQADFENYRKRVAKDVSSAGARAKIGLVRDLLPVVDNLERALASAENGGAGLAEGVRLVLSELQGVFAREGVEALEPAGEPFDPTVHEALSTRAEEGAKPGVVLDVVEKGYRTSDTVIRPARVVVST